MTPCKNGRHSLQTILRTGPEEEEAVVRWCEYCGCVVVDIDFDGRTNPGAIAKMRFPQVTKELEIKC